MSAKSSYAPVHHVVHASEVWPDANIVVLHCVLAAHSVEAWKGRQRDRETQPLEKANYVSNGAKNDYR